MKKVLIVLLVLVILAIVAVAVFVSTFDVNRYNKIIASQISAAVGNPVEIGRLSLGWKNGLLLGVEKFQVIVEENGQKTPELSFDHADMALELLPLLKTQLKISSISITRPSIHLVRSKDGKFAILGYDPKPVSVTQAVTKTAAVPVALNFSISSITIRNGMLRIEDYAQDPAADIVIDSLDADIKNVSLVTPLQFVVKMALLSARQNVDISGTAGGFTTAPLYVKDMNAELDLETIDYAKLMRAMPAAQKMGIKEGLDGLLKAKISDLELIDGNISKLSADLSFTDGKVSLAQIKAPVEHVNLYASIENDKVSVKSFSAALANATLSSSGSISNIYVQPDSSLKVDAQIPGAKQFLLSIAGGRQYLDGKIALSLEGSMSGASWDIISKTLSGRGSLSLDDGVLLDTNILTQSLGALSMFPGLIDTLSGFVPAPVREALGRQHTLLKPVRQSFTVKDGVAALPDLKFETDFADVNGTANLTLQGELTGNCTIRFMKELSDSMIKAVPQMKYLADQQGIIGFPITFKASGYGVSIVPDLQYIATRAVARKGQEMVSDLLKKATEAKQESKPGQVTETRAQSSGISDFMNKVKALANESQGTPQTQ